MSTRIGYVLHGHDNDSYLLRGVPDLIRCSECGELLDRRCSLSHFRIVKKLDVSATYDGYTLVSQRFVDVWNNCGGTGLIFTSLPEEPGYFLIDAEHVIGFDAKRRKTRFEEYRQCCGNFHSVAGATPAFLKSPDSLKGRRAFKTDVMFGSGDEKHPLIILPLSLGDALKESALSGLDLSDVLL